MTEKTRAWTAADEIKFIEGLGTHSQLQGMSRKELLRRYREAMKRRVRWGHVKRSAVEGYVDASTT